MTGGVAGCAMMTGMAVMYRQPAGAVRLRAEAQLAGQEWKNGFETKHWRALARSSPEWSRQTIYT